MQRDSAMVRLELGSTPESGTLVRALLVGVGSALGWSEVLLDDLKTAVTEACNNVVLHAYGGGVGKLIVRLDTAGEWIEIVVCDEGAGLHGVTISDDHLRVGMPVISSLADRAEFLSPPSGGTEVRMFFRADRDGSRGPAEERPGFARRGERGPDPRTLNQVLNSWTADSVASLVGERSLLWGEVIGVVAPVALLGPALGRLVRALAAVNHFRLDRFSELRLLTDALGAHARATASDGRLGFTLAAGKRRLELAAGPFTPGSGAVFRREGLEVPGSPLRGLADELSVESGQRGEVVRLLVADPR